MNECIEITRRFSDGRIVTVSYSDPNEKRKAIEDEKKHQDEKYESVFSNQAKAIMEGFADLCSTLEWD